MDVRFYGLTWLLQCAAVEHADRTRDIKGAVRLLDIIDAIANEENQ